MNNRELNPDKYHDYLKTEQWKGKALERARIDHYQCCMCGCIGTQSNPLQAHHMTYYNIYHEDVYKDLVTLCKNCHKSVHRMMNRVTDQEGRKGWKDSLIVSNHVLQDSNESIEL